MNRVDGRARGLQTLAVLLAAAALGACASKPQEVTVQSLEIGQASTALKMGQERSLTATAVLSDGTRRDVTQQASWTSRDAAVVQVEDAEGARGRVSARGVGTTSIVAAYDAKSAEVELTVTPALKFLAVEPGTANTRVGAPFQFRARAVYEDGTARDVTREVAWQVEPSALAVMDASASGRVTPLDAGTAMVQAVLEGMTAKTRLVISPALVRVGLAIAVAEVLTPNQTAPYEVYAGMSDGSQVLLEGATVVSSDESVLRVQGSSVKAVDWGVATLTARDEGLVATWKVFVTEPGIAVDAPPLRITTSPGTRSRVLLPVYAHGHLLAAGEQVSVELAVKKPDGNGLQGVKVFIPAEGEEGQHHSQFTHEVQLKDNRFPLTAEAGDLASDLGLTEAFSPETGRGLKLFPISLSIPGDAALTSEDAPAFLEVFTVVQRTLGDEWIRFHDIPQIPLSLVPHRMDVVEGLESTMGVGQRSLVKVQARLADGFDADAKLRWKVQVQRRGPDTFAPVESLAIYYRTSEPDDAPHTSWVQSFSTDARGVAWFGPAEGFTASQAGLTTGEGTTTGFSVAAPMAGLFSLQLSLVHLGADMQSDADDQVVYSHSELFRASPGAP